MRRNLYKDLFTLEEKHWWHINKRETCFALMKQYINKKHSTILDVGCGTGKNIDFFKKWGSCWGVDSSATALAFCKKRGLTTIKKGNAENAPFNSASFDIITMLDVLEHADDKKSLIEARRLLKKGGYIIITVPAYPFLWSQWDEVLHHKRRYTRGSLHTLLADHHFSIIKISYMYSFLLIPVIIVRIIKSFLYKKEYPSDFRLSSPLLNTIFLYIARCERALLLHASIPFGTSVVVVAKKNV